MTIKSEVTIGSSAGVLKPETIQALDRLAVVSPERVAQIHLFYTTHPETELCMFAIIFVGVNGSQSDTKYIETEDELCLLIYKFVEDGYFKTVL